MPDVNGAIVDYGIDVLKYFGIQFEGSGGDPTAIREQAALYSRQAEALRVIYQRGVDSMPSGWSGAAADSYDALLRRQEQVAMATADHLDLTATELAAHSDKAEDIVRTILGIALELLEVYIATLVLSAVAAWLAQALLLARSAWLVARAFELCRLFRQLVAEAVDVMRGLGTMAGEIAARIGEVITDWVPDYARETVSFGLGSEVPTAMSGQGPGDVGAFLRDTLLPFEMLDFIGYFGLHLLEKYTVIGGRLKDFVAGPGTGAGHEIEVAEPIPTAAEAPQLPPLEFEPWAEPVLRQMFGESDDMTIAEELPHDRSTATVDEVRTPTPPVAEPDYVPDTAAEVVYGFLAEFSITGTANVVLDAAQHRDDAADMLWAAFGGGAFAAVDKAVRQRYLLPLAMSRRPAGVPLELWLATVGMVVKTGIRSFRFTLKDPFSALVGGADIDTQFGSMST